MEVRGLGLGELMSRGIFGKQGSAVVAFLGYVSSKLRMVWYECFDKDSVVDGLRIIDYLICQEW